jgi:hypothetical protein
MIISHKYRYLFIEVPHTASTAISRELRAQYDGTTILRKHATYSQFLEIASEEEKQYFVFAGVRNPLDVAVTKYMRYKTNHNQIYTTPRQLVEHGGSVSWYDLMVFRFTQRSNSDFAAYFRIFHRLPYSDAVSRDAKEHAQFIIRFEHLQEDFAEVLRRLGIEQKRPLPQVNKTKAKETDFLSCYSSDITQQATQVFGPYMEEWGYQIPPEWDTGSVSTLSRLNYQMVNTLRDFYWKRVKWSPRFYGRLSRLVK